MAHYRQATALAQPLSSDTDYHAVAQLVVEIKQFRAEWDSFMKPIRKATKEAHSIACAQFNEIDDPIEEILERIEPMLLQYEQRQDARRAAEETRLNEEIAKQRDPSDTAVALTVTLPKLTPPAGLARRSTWKAQITDLQKLVLAVAEGKAPLAYLIPNEQVLNLQARALKGELSIPGVVAVEEIGYAAKGH